MRLVLRLFFQCHMHAFVSPILLWVARFNTFDVDTEP